MNNDNSNINNYNQQAQQIWQEAMQKIEALSQQQLQNINTNPNQRIKGALNQELGYEMLSKKTAMICDSETLEYSECTSSIEHYKSSDSNVLTDSEITLQKR